MQGLPIQNLMKQAVKGDAKATSHNASIKNAGENNDFSALLGNATATKDAKNVNVDFSELLNGEKSKGEGQKGEEAKAELLLGKEASAGKVQNLKVENKLAKEVEGTSNGLDQLLANLKNDTVLNITSEMFINYTSIDNSLWSFKEILDKSKINF